jgi:hypothetical protein
MSTDQGSYAMTKSQTPVWEKSNPKAPGKSKPLTAAQKSTAKKTASKAGRPYPNLVDNMNVAKKGTRDAG